MIHNVLLPTDHFPPSVTDSMGYSVRYTGCLGGRCGGLSIQVSIVMAAVLGKYELDSEMYGVEAASMTGVTHSHSITKSLLILLMWTSG
jgi:hypothetical protein